MVVGSHRESPEPVPCAICVLVSIDQSFEAECHVPLGSGPSRYQIHQRSVLRHYDSMLEVLQVDCNSRNLVLFGPFIELLSYVLNCLSAATSLSCMSVDSEHLFPVA